MRMRLIVLAALLPIVVYPTSASACATVDKASQSERKRQQERYLRDEADIIVTGTWHAKLPERELDIDPDIENEGTAGFIDVERGRKKIRYRVFVPNLINCGFPNYSLEEGAYGKFYLKADEDPDDNDMEDGVIDNFAYVHFEPLRREKN